MLKFLEISLEKDNDSFAKPTKTGTNFIKPGCNIKTHGNVLCMQTKQVY